MTDANLTPRAIYNHLAWSNSGTVEAWFETPCRNLRHAPAGARSLEYARWVAAYTAVGAQFVHQTVVRQVSPSAIQLAMASQLPNGLLDLPRYPHWNTKINETIAALAAHLDQPPVEKISLLKVILPVPQIAATRIGARVARAVLLGHEPAKPTDNEIAVALKAANRLQGRLAKLIPHLRPLSAADMQWLTAYSTTFGGIETPYTHADFGHSRSGLRRLYLEGDAIPNPKELSSNAHLAFDAPIVYDPILEVDRNAGRRQQVYQHTLRVVDFADSWTYPHGALWNGLDDLSYPVRSAIIGTPINNRKARSQLDGIFKALDFTSRESEGDTTPHVDAEAAEIMARNELAALARHGGPAIPTTILITVAASDPETLAERIDEVKDTLDGSHTRLQSLNGSHAQAWQAMNPGSTPPYAIINQPLQLHAADVAGLGITHGWQLGNSSGRILGLAASTVENAPPQLVMRDATYGPKANQGNNGLVTAWVGRMGAGKTTQSKEDVHDLRCQDNGAFIITTDPEREWHRAATAMPGSVQIVDPIADNPLYRANMDPLRVFTGNLPSDNDVRAGDLLMLAEEHTIGFYVGKMGIVKDHITHDVLTEAVQTILDASSVLAPSSPNLRRLLDRWAGNLETDANGNIIEPAADDPILTIAVKANVIERDAAATLALKIRNLARHKMWRNLVFSDTPTVDLTTGMIVAAAPGIDPASPDGTSFIYLAAAVSLAFLYRTPRINVVVVSDLAALEKTTQGQKLVTDIQLHSRKANGGFIGDYHLVSHAAAENAALFITRFAGSTPNMAEARRALEFVGLEDPTDADATKLVHAETGEFFMRDPEGRFGWVGTFPPLNAARQEAFRTDTSRLTEEDVA